MDYNNMRKAQLIDELIKLRQKNKELEEAPKDYAHMSMLSKSFLNKRWFSDGGPASKIFYSAPDIMAIVNLKGGHFVEINEAFIASFAYERYEVIGRNAEELALFLVPGEKDALINRIRAGRNIRDFEIRVKSKYGEIRILLIATEKIELDAEEYIIVMARDITMRKQVEERLRISEECLSKAFDTSPIVMTITTLEEGRFIRANQAFQRIVGYDHREVIGRTSLEIGFWLNKKAREPLIQRIRAGQPLRDLETTFGTKRGEERMGLLSAEGINVNGVLCVIGVLTDITEFKKMEAGIAHLDALNMVGEMAASIAHEIRNPMTTVRGYLQLMRENKDNLKEQEYYDLMIEELDRANAILTDFLSLAKDKPVDMRKGNFNDIINKVLPLIQARALSKEHCIKLELGEIPCLPLDNQEIRQLILNLVNNGLESMSLPGYFTIKTYVEDEEVVVAFCDQGPGIDPSQLDKLGTPFFTTKENGTGLGLSVCYRIVERHNGEINIDSSPSGTSFYIRFPNRADSW